MRHQVTGKQPNSRNCMVCGMKNEFSVRTFFYELDNGELFATFQPRDEHQGYPGRLHGGIAAAVLDEAIGRAILMLHEEEVWGVTMAFTTQFQQPIPLNEKLRIVGRITDEDEKYFEGTGEILLADGSVAAEGHGRYRKLPIEVIADFDVAEQDWGVVDSPDDPQEVDLGK